jgi:Ca2+-binding RTX toxin-like protein
VAQDAIKFAEQVASANKGATITLTGHSLGGYAAQAALVRLTEQGDSNVSAVTFNAPGLPSWFLNGVSPGSYNCYNFNTRGDILHLFGGTQIGQSTSLDVGPSPAQEMSDFLSHFQTVGRFSANAGKDVGIAYVLLDDWLTAAHTIGNFAGTNSYDGQEGIFSADPPLGSLTAQEFFAYGNQTPQPSSLSVSSDGTISLSDSAGDLLTVKDNNGNIQTSFTPGSASGLSNPSGLQSEFAADGPAILPLSLVADESQPLPGGSAIIGTVTAGVGGDTSAVIGTEAVGGSGLPGQIYVPDSTSDNRYECNIPVTGSVSEVIDSNGQGTVWVNSTLGYGQLTGGSPVQGTPDTWKDSNGTQYVFSGSPNSDIGTLTISGGLLGSDPANSVTIQNFNLAAAATSAGGFLGIQLGYAISLAAGTGASSGSSATFPAGSEQSYTLSVDAPNAQAETITVTLSGASPSDFDLDIGDECEQLNSNTFTVTLPAGERNVSFGLIDVTATDGTSDIAGGATLTLTASVTNPADSNGSPIKSSPLSITYTPEPQNTAAGPQGGDPIAGKYDSVTGITTYQGDGGDDYISAGQGPNRILAQNSGSDSIIGGAGNNTIYGGSGNDVIDLSGSHDIVSLGDGYNTLNGGTGQDSIYAHGGTSIINGNGGTDLIFGGNGTNQIYADSQTGLANAIADASSGSATGQQGDLLSVGDGDNTIVSGSGNDLVTAGTGHDVVVLGPGDDTFEGGIDVTDGLANWYTTVTRPNGNYLLSTYNVDYITPSYSNPYPQPYNGVTVDNEVGVPDAAIANDTIFAGNGNDFIYLGNGDNYVGVGSGQDSIFGGMGNDTIVAGSGADYIRGGGGTDYIYGGAGLDTIYGGDGNNTIIAGSGDATITSANGPTPQYAGATLEQNYVFGGSGNDVIYGSAGNDTLIAGSGRTTINGQSGNEYIVGGSGSDVLAGGTGNNTIFAGSGADTLYANGSSSSSSYLYGGDGPDVINGGRGTNVIYAGDGGTADSPTSVFGSNDSSSQTTIYGGLGDDSLQGGDGTTVIYAGDGGTSSAPDSVFAGSGNTTIYGGLGTDLIQGGSGTDLLYAGDGGTADAPTSVLGESGTATLYGGAGEDILQDTTAGSDLIVAGTGDDTLSGTGNDTLVAGSGNDALQTFSDGVSIDIGAGFGDDTVHTTGATENINFGAGIAPTDFTGGLATDPAGNEYLVLIGDGGTVLLEDAFTGGLGSITYGDPTSISPGALMTDVFGTDQTYYSGSTLTPSSSFLFVSVQNDDYLVTGNYNDTVSSWGDNATIGGAATFGHGDDIYSAGASADITASEGHDTIVAIGDADTVTGFNGDMKATVSGANSIVTAGVNADTLTASGLNDSLIGNGGNTLFVVENASDVISVLGGGGTDTVESSVSYTAPSNVNILTLIGAADIAGTANSGNDLLTAGAGNDTLIAGAGADTLVGGSGSTTFVINSASDVVRESSTAGNDVVQSSVSFSLPTNVNTLELTGSAALIGTANGGADVLISNGGADTLIGGAGNDTFVVDNAGVVVQDGASGSGNTIESSVSYSLPGNVNTLVLTGTADLVGTANGANDTLVSNTGVDTLVGGGGHDLFIVNNPDDVLVNVTASDTVEMMSSGYSLPPDIDLLVLTGSADVSVTGNSGDDSITANAGSDTLVAGSGVDTFVAGSGSDTFVLNSSSDVVQAGQATGSVIESSASYSLPVNVDVLALTGSASIQGTGNAGNDSLVSGAGADTLVAGSGADTLVAGSGPATLIGGSGHDTFIVNDSGDLVEDTASAAANTLISSVSYSLPTDVNTLVLAGSSDLSATTNGGNDLITGNAGADTLTATTGTDTLVAGSGPDTLVGGSGSDLFVVNDSADQVTVSGSSGRDTVESSVSYSLPANVAVLELTGSADLAASANGGNDSIVANAGNDTLVAGAGTDTLVAGAGPDTLIGGTGATTYVIDNAGDVIENVSAAPGNAVQSSVSFTLLTGIDALTLTGNGNLVGQGNGDASNVLTANTGNDTLIAGSAITAFEGGEGDDTFIINDTRDVVNASAVGTNAIVSSVSYSLPGNVSTLILTGSTDLVGTGNTLADSIVGNAGSDTLVAGIGNDTLVAGTGPATLIGGVGNDTFVINSASDVLEDTVSGEHNTVISSVSLALPADFNVLTLAGTGNLVGTANSANDLITGNAGEDTLVAGAGADTLVAGIGLDTLVGGTGNTTFEVDNAGDAVQGASATSSNTVIATVSYTAPDNVDSLQLAGPGNIAGTGNAGADTLRGGEGEDTLVAGSGPDTLIGGTGNTTFVVNGAGDVVVDGSATASNSVQSSVSFSLPQNVSTLQLTGSANLVGTANAGEDTLIGNSGVDTLIGAGGSALFVVANAGDVVEESSAAANDTVQSSVSFSLPVNVDVLVLTGSDSAAGSAPVGTANSANDTLVSGSGVYEMVGGAGNDLFLVNNSADSVVASNAGSADTIQASVSFSLPTNIDTLVLTGTGDLAGTGNGAADLIVANGGKDTLTAGAGADTLVGGGQDLLIVNSSADVTEEGSTSANDTVESSVSYSLASNVDTLVLEGSANLTATANGGNDTLVSNAGVDTLVGGGGHDVFVVNNPGDLLVNVTASDTIESSVSYGLPAGAAALVVTGNGLTGTGNSGSGTLIARGSGDSLVAASGVATLIGAGSTDFFVNNSGDGVLDSSYSAHDTIDSSVSYSLPANVDELRLGGSGNLTGTGNEDEQNTLIGGSGNDTLVGTALENTFYGGSGADTIDAGPGGNRVYLGSGGTADQPTEVFADASGTSDLTNAYIYGGSGVSNLYGGPGYNYLQAGSGTAAIYAGAGTNQIYGDTAAGASGPLLIFGNAAGTDAATESTLYGGSGGDVIYGGPGSDLIYAGSGADTVYSGSGYETSYGGSGADVLYGGQGSDLIYGGSGPDTIYDGSGSETTYGGSGVDVIFGGPGSDLIYGGSGTDTLYSGSGSDSIYGAAGDLLEDYSSGQALLAAGAGAETLMGIGGDTLAAGSGADLLYSEGQSSLSTVYEFGPGFGQVTVGNPTSRNDTLLFGSGVTPGALTLGESVSGSTDTASDIALTINDGTGTILVRGGLLPGTVGTVEFADPSSESFKDFMNAYGPGLQSINFYYNTSSILSTGNNQSVSTGSAAFVFAFGDGDTLADTWLGSTAYAYGNQDTINAQSSLWAAGTADSIVLGSAAAVTLAGANDTVTADGGGNLFVVQQSSDVIDVGAGAGNDSVEAYVNYSLPVNVQTLYLEGADLSAASNSQGGTLVAEAGGDTLTGGAGGDTLEALGNFDALVGGSGAETYVLSNGSDSIQFGAGPASAATVVTLFSYTLPSQANSLILQGNFALGAANAGNDSLTAQGQGDTLVGGSGNDTLVAGSAASPATLVGGTGPDTFVINDTADVVEGGSANDTVESSVSISLPANVESILLTRPGLEVTANGAADTITAPSNDTIAFDRGFGQDEILGAESGDVIAFAGSPGTGGAAPSLVISGDGGAITVQGGLVPGVVSGVSFGGGAPVPLSQLLAGSGPVTVAGADGNLILTAGADSSVTGGAGNDTIVAWGSGDTLTAGSGGADIYAYGNDDLVTGSSGADTLDALGSGDTLVGGSGAERFIVSSSSDVVTNGSSRDTLYSSVSYSLPAGIDALVLTGSAALQGTGNAGADTLVAGSGDDTLVSGSGIDTMIGGSGADTYVVHNTGDVVEPSSGGQPGAVVSSVSFSLPVGVNSLELTGYGISGAGNGANDFLATDSSFDTIAAGSGNDTLLSQGQNNVLIAGSGRDSLTSEDGFSSLVTGTGIDTVTSTYDGDGVYINNPEDLITELGQNSTIHASMDYTVPSNLFVAFDQGFTVQLTGSADLVAADDSSLNDTIVGNSGHDTLIGGPGYNTFSDGSGYGGSPGTDTMIGGARSNYFNVSSAADVVLAPAGSYDTIASSVSLTLPANVDTLLVVGGGIVGTGNADNDTLIGASSEIVAGSGNDSLAGEGDCTLVAGSGRDTLSPYNDSDTIVLNQGSGGTEILTPAAGGTLGPIIEFGSGVTPGELTASAVTGTDGQQAMEISGLAGSVTINGALGQTPYRYQFDGGPVLGLGQFLLEVSNDILHIIQATGPDQEVTGGSGMDSLVGDYAGDTLVGGSGPDTFVAGGGSVTVVINNASDVIQVSGTGGNDTVDSSVSYTLGTGLDTLVLTGSGIQGQGNADSANLMEGTSSDLLTAGSGNDTLIAAAGDETLIGGTGNDSLVAGSGDDLLTAGSASDTLVAGSGSATLQGGSGADTYLFNAGFGQAEIEPSSAGGTIQFGAGVAPSDLTVGLTTDSYSNPALLIQDGGSSITVAGGLTGSVGTFDFAGGTQLTLGGLLAAATVTPATIAGASGNAILDNAAGVSLSAGSGQDTIVATGASDTLTAGNGSQYLSGTGTADSLVGGYGNDTLVAAGSADTVVAGNGNQQLYGLGESDVLGGGIGADTLYGGAGNDTLIAGSGDTEMHGGNGIDTLVLTRGSTATFYPSNQRGQVIIDLPAGMTLADFTSYQSANGDLVLQSLSGDTTAVIKGFYDSSSSDKVWMIADASGDVQFLASWVQSQHQIPSDYAGAVDEIRQAYGASLAETLNQIGQQGGSIERPANSSVGDLGYDYQFSGVTTRSLAVQGGSLTLPTSEHDQSATHSEGSAGGTYPASVPVDGGLTIPGTTVFIPQPTNPTAQTDLQNELANGNSGGITAGTDSQGSPGYSVTLPSTTGSEQTGTTTVSAPDQQYSYGVGIISSYTQEIQSFTAYDVTGDGGNDVITSQGPFVGTVVTGNGNVDVNLGMDNDGSNAQYYNYPQALPPGAFIEAGDGVDTLVGTGGTDVVTAGMGFDQIEVGIGSTVYVPLQGVATDVITVVGPAYGSGPLPPSTLVLPSGVTPADLTYRLYSGATSQVDQFGDSMETLQVSDGDSSVLMNFSASGPSYYGGNLQNVSDDWNGISQIQFSDGTVLTRDQILAMAGPATPASGLNPTVTSQMSVVYSGTPVDNSCLFSSSDSSGLPITWYQVSNTGADGGYFTLNGVEQTPGTSFYISKDQLADLEYVPGTAGTTDTLQISAFDGVVWGTPASFNVNVASVFKATGADQTVTGPSSGYNQLIGGYAGDTLVGGSGQDAFVYNTGGGTEVISETAPASSSNNDVIQFGSGITPSSITVSLAGPKQLWLTIGSSGDQVYIENFNYLDPLASGNIQSFGFSGCTGLSLVQLIEQSHCGDSGAIRGVGGTRTNFTFATTGQTVYSAETTNSSGQILESVTLSASGTQITNTYTYNSDGSYTDTQVTTTATDPTTVVYDYNAEGQPVTKNTAMMRPVASDTNAASAGEGGEAPWWQSPILAYKDPWMGQSYGEEVSSVARRLHAGSIEPSAQASHLKQSPATYWWQGSNAAYDDIRYGGMSSLGASVVSRKFHEAGMPTGHLAFGGSGGGEDAELASMQAGIGEVQRRADFVPPVRTGLHSFWSEV